MAAMDGVKRILGLRVEADDKAIEIIDTYRGSGDLVRLKASLIGSQTEKMSGPYVREFLPGLCDQATTMPSVQRRAAVVIEAERVMRAQLATHDGDGPLDPHIRKAAIDNVKGDPHIFAGGSFEGHIRKEAQALGEAVDGFLSSGPARERAFRMQAEALHADVKAKRPDLTVQHVEAHVRSEAAKAMTGYLSKETGERLPTWVVSQAQEPLTRESIEKAGVMGDPMRTSHTPTRSRDWMDPSEARQAAGLRPVKEPSITETAERQVPTVAPEKVKDVVRNPEVGKAAMAAAHNAIGR